MNKFNELLKLNNEIKLLEANGNFKAANILSKKFFKKAEEKKPPTYKPTTIDDTPNAKETPEPQSEFSGVRDYSDLLNDLGMNSDNYLFDKYYQEYKDNINLYPEDEQNYLNAGVKRLLKQRRQEGLKDPVVKAKKPYVPGKVDENTTPDFTSGEWKKYNPQGYVVDSPVENFQEGIDKFKVKDNVDVPGQKNNSFQDNAKEFDKEMTRIISNSNFHKDYEFNYAESILDLMKSQLESLPEETKAHYQKLYDEMSDWLEKTKSKNRVFSNENLSSIPEESERFTKYKERILKFKGNLRKLNLLRNYIIKERNDKRISDKEYEDLIALINQNR